MKQFSYFVALLLLTAAASHAQENAVFTGPGSFQSTGTAPVPQTMSWSSTISNQEKNAGTGGGFSPMSLVSAPEIAEAITPEIEALARGLENDPKKIFDYVHDQVRYVHYFGSKKGAQLTLLERSGNDFDQCALLVALLRAAGQSASYRFSMVYMPYSQGDHRDFQHWLGLTKPNTNWTETSTFVTALNFYRGWPQTGVFGGDTNDLIFHHVWVLTTYNGTNYSLDPSFKVSEPIAGITNLATAMGLDTNQLMTVAAGTSTADYAQNLNEANLRNKLRDYTTNLLGYLQSNYPNASVEDIIGGKYIVSSVGQSLDQALPFIPFTTPAPALDWDYIPTNLMTSLQITVDNTNCLLRMPQLQGQRLSLTFSNTGLAQLWLEDDLLMEKQTSGGSSVNVSFFVDHPHGTWDFVNNTLINTNLNDQFLTSAYQRTNASYAVCYAFEPDQDWLRQRQDRLDQYRQQGLADTSREVTTETLNIMGLNWMLQTERMEQVLAAQQDLLLQYHHRLGRMAQEAGRGYYIDIAAEVSGIYSASGRATSDKNRSDRMFDLGIYFGSAAEHGVIEQLQASNLVAASTIKMLQIGNANGQRIYLAKSSNWTTVQANLSNYNNNYLKTNYIDNGYSLLLPANGSNLLAGAGSWAGYGIAARLAITNTYKFSMLIRGDYNGGYSAFPNVSPNPGVVSQNGASQPTFFDPSPYLPNSFGADPVSMADGSFHLNATDLSLGQAEPRGLAFSRHYNSNRRYQNPAGMANGWIHNYNVVAIETSAPLASLGDTTPAQMAPLVVATRAALALYSLTNTSPKNWAVTALIAKWGVDQLINNAVSLSLGKDTIQFIRQPNGVYTPPASSTMTLIKTNGGYWLQERHGNTFKFNPGGLLTNIVDQYNQSLKLTYNGSGLVTNVSDWKNRWLTFNYTGTPARLAVVSDSTGRSVSYGYVTNAGQLDLAFVTDPENKTCTYLYDTNHLLIVTKDALNQMVVSNLYDNAGRVATQYTQGDTNKIWQVLWTGWENVEQDPAGGKRRFSYDDKSRLIGQRDALGNLSQTVYDGQDHIVKTISPLNETNRFEFDGRHNLLRSIDPLGFTNQFVYDAQDNLVRTVDARGNTNFLGYNAKFQLTGLTNGTGDWTTFAYNGTDGLRTNRTDAGGSTGYGYDANGYLGLITHPGGLGGEGFLNNALGDVLSHTNARQFVTTFQYNNRRELTNTVAPTNLISRIAYDPVGNVLSTTDPRGFATTNTWSATRKLLAITSPVTPQGIPVASNVYDGRDWLARTVNNPSTPVTATTSYTNDAAQRLIAVSDPLQRVSRFGYDAVGRQLAATNAAQEVTRQEWSQRGELLKITDPATRIVNRVYDAAGNQVVLTNRNGKKWQFQFDKANRLTNTITPLGRETRIGFDARGLVSTVREPSTQTLTNLYDAKGRLTNAADQVNARLYRYDANDNVTNIIENGKTNAWIYDAYDRVNSYRDADGNLIQYRYDANGNVTNLIYPGNRAVVYAYDSLNRLTNVTDWQNRKTTITYDLASRVKTISRPNGTTRLIDYDAAGQTTNIIEMTAGGAGIAVFKLNWNSAGRVAWEFVAPLPHAYSMPGRTNTFDDDNRMATFNGGGVTYDSDGNFTYGPLTNNPFVTYAYDARNRLLNVGGVTNAYDPAGNRVAITNGVTVTKFVVNPNAKLSQVLMRVRPGVTNYYIHGLGLQYEITETASTTNTLTYHYDYRGSTVALTDGNGNVTDRMEYSAYALTTYRTGTNDTPFLYNGRYGVQTDPNGLLYMRARFYNPYLCRFLNADPSGFGGGLNFYAYADGNPVSYLDPFGLGATGEGIASSWLGLYQPGQFPSIPGPNSYFYGNNFAGNAAASVGNMMSTILNGAYQVGAGFLNGLGVLGEGIGMVETATVGTGGFMAIPAFAPEMRLFNQAAAFAAETRLPANIASTFSGGRYTSTVLGQDMTAFRYSGGISQPAGRFLTTGDTVSQISSPVSASIALNLPGGATAQTLNTFTIPAGTRIFTGGVAGGADTATQIFIRDPSVLIPH